MSQSLQVAASQAVIVPANLAGAPFTAGPPEFGDTVITAAGVPILLHGSPDPRIGVSSVVSVVGPGPVQVGDLVADLGTWAFQNGGQDGVSGTFGVPVVGGKWNPGDHIYLKVIPAAAGPNPLLSHPNYPGQWAMPVGAGALPPPPPAWGNQGQGDQLGKGFLFGALTGAGAEYLWQHRNDPTGQPQADTPPPQPAPPQVIVQQPVPAPAAPAAQTQTSNKTLYIGLAVAGGLTAVGLVVALLLWRRPPPPPAPPGAGK